MSRSSGSVDRGSSVRGRLRGLTVLLLGFGSVGCVTAIHYEVTAPEAGQCVDAEARSSTEQIVGLALSGGGSRAAVFAAAGMEALWERGLLEPATHLSSVSGGSIAAAYYVVNRPGCETVEGSDARVACWRAYFAEFKKAMRYNFQRWALFREWYKFRWLSNSRRATTLRELLDEQLLDDTTFADLRSAPRAGAPRGPVLFVNAASYDAGRRFVFSNQCFPAGAGRETSASEAATALRFDPLDFQQLRALTFSRPGCERPVPGDMPVSLAVATSAAVPPVIGPVTIRESRQCGAGESSYLHLGDGGTYDNTAIDTLEEVMLRTRAAASSSLKRSLILSLDSRQLEDPDYLLSIRNFWLAYHGGRIPYIAQKRGHAYHEMVWGEIAKDLRASGVDYEAVVMRYTNARLERWPDSCRAQIRETRRDESPAQTRERIRIHLSRVPTALEISDCDADLLEMAARDVVAAILDGEALDRLRHRGFEFGNPRRASAP